MLVAVPVIPLDSTVTPFTRQLCDIRGQGFLKVWFEGTPEIFWGRIF